ncbi:MAG: 3-oxoacid CoA-transferase subunit A [Pseudomonadota bacterium]|nr:3-oxoacid CoA-transferase subunit A [Pseudomonadota bacterium]
MIDKRVKSLEVALDGFGDGSSVLVNGFGGAGVPFTLIKAIENTSATNLTLILNSIRFVDGFAPQIFAARRVSKVICTAARSRGHNTANYEHQWLDGDLEIEMVPQGTFAERIRAGGAGIPAFFTPTGAGTELADGKETRDFNGKPCVLEQAITADFAIIRAAQADRWGNVRFRGTQGNFGLAMAMAAKTTIVETDDAGDKAIPPEDVHIPGIYVDHVFPHEDMRPANAGGI